MFLNLLFHVPFFAILVYGVRKKRIDQFVAKCLRITSYIQLFLVVTVYTFITYHFLVLVVPPMMDIAFYTKNIVIVAKWVTDWCSMVLNMFLAPKKSFILSCIFHFYRVQWK